MLQASPGFLIDPQIAAALIVAVSVWAGWVSTTLVKSLTWQARMQPILDVLVHDLGTVLKQHPGHHSLSAVEEGILDRFEGRIHPAPSDDEIEYLRQAADRERDDPANPSDLRMGFALLQGALRSEQEARKGNWLKRLLWNFHP